MDHNRPKEDHLDSRPPQDVSSGAAEHSPSEQHDSPKPTSLAKIEANRRNAQKSTGPRTAEGKARSRWNAVKHGILSARLLASEAADRGAFVQLLESLSEDWLPEGTLEQILVEKLAMGYWRLHVAYGYEVDFARSSNDFFASIDRTGRYATSIHRQMMQDISQLERLQRQRKGEFVPAPISVTLTCAGADGDGYAEMLHEVAGPSLTTGLAVLMNREAPDSVGAFDESGSTDSGGPHDASDPAQPNPPDPAAQPVSAGTNLASGADASEIVESHAKTESAQMTEEGRAAMPEVQEAKLPNEPTD